MALSSNEIYLLIFGPPACGIGGMLLGTLFYVRAQLRFTKRQELVAGLRYFKGYMLQIFLVVCGLSFFCLALDQPAVRNDWGGGSIKGWGALVLGFPFYGVNFWLLFSPLVLVWLYGVRTWWFQLIPLANQIICVVIVTIGTIGRDFQYPGSYLWVTAFYFVALAYAVPTGLMLKKASLIVPPPNEQVAERVS